ncbi:MAG: T9SS type A sorting domain-containing protein [Ignavibacteriae bacterium]|nr:T9SS type A sorting domain-containing protein [Ignavibacteriota bacterium]
MKKITTTIISLVLLLIMMYGSANAQLTGTKTIPGTYASIKLAIDDLNTNGVGTGGVTFDIAPGYTETIPMGGLIIDITTNQPTSGNPVVFQRSGAGTNPLIQTDTNGSGIISNVGIGARRDAMLCLVGTDHIAINNIDFAEQYTGGSQVLKTEYGIEMVRKSSTDGCKHVTITGCTIQMRQSDFQSTCITSINVDLAGNTTNPTTIGGRHESISVQGCTLNNSFNGMFFMGYAAAAPYDLYDHFYNIGGITGNTLINIGAGLGTINNANTKYGIYFIYHDSVTVSNNVVRVNSGSSNSVVYGIHLSVAKNSSATINNNDISDTCKGTTQIHSAIYCRLGESGVDNTVNITNNTIHDCRYDGATTASNYYIYLEDPYTANVTGNTIRDNYVGNGSSTATGRMYGIYRSAANTEPGSSFTVANNTIKNLRRNQSTPAGGLDYCIYVEGGAYNYEVSNNTVDSILSTTSTGDMAGIVCSYTSPGLTSIHDNNIANLYKLTSTSGTMYGIATITNNTDSIEIYNNNLSNMYHQAVSGITMGISKGSNATEGFGKIYNNVAHDIHIKSSNFCVGIYATSFEGTCIQSIYGNKVYNVTNDSTGSIFGLSAQNIDIGVIHSNWVYGISGNGSDTMNSAASGMYISAASFTSNLDVYNNMISEIYGPLSNSNNGVLGLIVSGGDTTNISYNTIYIDSSSSGSNTGGCALYITGKKATLKNNIIINKFTHAGTRSTIGIYKYPTTVYDSLSNNNNVYVPTGASNYFYHDGITGYATFSGFQTTVAPAENNSFTEDSPFMNVVSHPYDLDINPSIPTLCDGRAIPITGITTDIHGTTRNLSTPDVGADEFDQVITGIEPGSAPISYELYQNYPNPFNPSTKIKFDIPKAGFVSLKVYDITGREVSTLVNSELTTGRYEFEWNGAQFASGVYFLRINAGDFVKVQKMMLIK